MRRHPCVQRRGSRYRFRKKVPPELVPIIGKREITKSLETSDLREANKRAAVEQLKADNKLEAARRTLENSQSGTPQNAVTDDELRRVAIQWFERFLRNGERKLARESFPASELSDFLEAIDQEIDYLSVPDDPNNLASTQAVANELIEEFALPINSGDDAYLRLCHFINRGFIERLKRTRAYVQSNYDTNAFDPLFSGSLSALPPAPEPASARSGRTLRQVMGEYENDPARQNVSPATVRKVHLSFELFDELLDGERDIRSITRQDTKAVREALSFIPKNKKQRFPNLSLSEAIERGRSGLADGLAPKTIKSHLETLSALFEYALHEGYIDKNPARRLTVNDPHAAREKRDPFSIHQLNAIFQAPLYTGCVDDERGIYKPGPNHPKRARFWVPLLSLYGGLRMNEACQLYVADIEKVDGVYVIRIEQDEQGDKSVKTQSSTRMVPIHPALKKMGFIDYWEIQKKNGEERLFPELRKGRLGRYSDAFQKWFSHFLSKQGVKTAKTSFHSFRHNFRDAMREASISEERTRALGGWAGDGGADSNYGSGLKASTLYQEICKIEYPGLDLSHLI